MNDISKWCIENNLISPYLHYAKNIYTQNGEDGIIEKLFNDLGISNGTVVEFGAWDGIYISNIYKLWRYQNYNALLIEGDKTKANELKKISEKYKNVETLECFISPDRNNQYSLDNILKSSKLDFSDENFNLLSIDIDSFDYQIWESLENFRPKIVICETNYTYKDTEYVGMNGCSLKSLIKLAENKGYEFVCFNLNGFFVRKDLIDKLIYFNKSMENMYIGLHDIENILQSINEFGNFTGSIRYLTENYKNLIKKEKDNL